MIVVPEELRKAVEGFRERLLGEKEVIIFHDTDQDGIVSGALLENLLEESGIEVKAYAKDRKDVRFERGRVYLLADIRLDKHILEEAKKKGVKIYYVDHHEPDGITENTVALNPWFVTNLPVSPFKYNTALLAWLVEGMREENDWKVAAAHWADHAEGEHTHEWMKEMRKRYPIEEIGQLIGLPDYFPDLSLDELRERVRKATSPEDILNDPELRKRKEAFEEELSKWGNVLERNTKKIVYIIIRSPLRRLRSPLATIYSARYPERVFIIGQEDDGTVSYSLRFQNAEKHGVHLGEIAKEAERLFGGRGGGHPPAAGLTLPKEREKEFREWVTKKLERKLGTAKTT